MMLQSGLMKSIINMSKFKTIIDVLMTLALLFLMSYNLIGDATHEVIGTVVMILFIVHHIMNRKWIKIVFKGKYTPFRMVQTILAVLVFVTMLMQMISGIILSKYVFSFVDLNGLTGIARAMHLIGAYWGFIFISLHLGMHWNAVICSVIKKLKDKSKAKQIFFALPSFLIAAYGIYAFIVRNIAGYMFFKSQFVFFNFDEPLILLLIDYLAIMGLFVFIGYYLSKTIKKGDYNNGIYYIK